MTLARSGSLSASISRCRGFNRSVEVGTPKELFANPGITGYAPSADGQRFLLNVPAGGHAAAAPITVVLNWGAGLAK